MAISNGVSGAWDLANFDTGFSQLCDIIGRNVLARVGQDRERADPRWWRVIHASKGSDQTERCRDIESFGRVSFNLSISIAPMGSVLLEPREGPLRLGILQELHCLLSGSAGRQSERGVYEHGPLHSQTVCTVGQDQPTQRLADGQLRVWAQVDDLINSRVNGRIGIPRCAPVARKIYGNHSVAGGCDAWRHFPPHETVSELPMEQEGRTVALTPDMNV